VTQWKSRWRFFSDKAAGLVGGYLRGVPQTPGEIHGFVTQVENLPQGAKAWVWMRLRLSVSRAEYRGLTRIRDEIRTEKAQMVRWRH